MAKILRDLRVDFASLVDEPANKHARVTLFKRDFSQDQRDRMAESGTAMPDGSFPIGNRSDLMNAIHAIGRAKNPEMAKAHIKRRAKALGATDMLPEDWMAKSGANCDDDMTEDEKKKKEQMMGKKDDAAQPAEDLTAKVAELTKSVADLTAENAELKKAAVPPPTEEDVLKSLPEAVRKRIEDAEKRAAEADEIAKSERDKRETREWIEKAKAYSALPCKPEEFGPVLKRIVATATPEDHAELDRVLKAANEIAERSALFTEVGRAGADSGSATERLNTLASTMVKDGKAKDYPAAVAEIAKSKEHAGLMADYQAERGRRN